MSLSTHHGVTPRLAWATFVACLSTLQFGYHLAELNAPEAVLLCAVHKRGPYALYNDTFWARHGRAECLAMGGAGIATATTMFTVGGFVAAVVFGASSVLTRVGRNALSKACALCFMAGSAMMAATNLLWVFSAGRFCTGVAAGALLVVSPILINELTPINHRGFLGSVLQLAVALGILAAQVVGYVWANDQQWRNIFVAALAVGTVQFVALFTTSESPKWLILNRGAVEQAEGIFRHLRTNHDAAKHEINHWRRLSAHVDTDTTALLRPPIKRTVLRRGSIDPSSLSIRHYLVLRRYLAERMAIFGLMTGQQLCGINAITFYGVRILKDIVPHGTNVLAVTCSLSVCNVVASMALSPFIDRVGRKTLLLGLALTMSAAAALLAVGLTGEQRYLAAAACFAFNVGYLVGLAPLPYLMVSELASHESLGAAQAVGTALNWAANAVVAFCFPIVQDAVGGYIFYGFFVICLAYTAFFALFVPETKGFVSAVDVWRSHRIHTSPGIRQPLEG